MSVSRSGHTYITKEGEVLEGREHKMSEYLIEYYHQENEGWSFQNRGNQDQTIVRLNGGLGIDDIEELLDKCDELNSGIRDRLTQMVESGQMRYHISISHD
jgi:hypothetical protein